MAKNVAEIDATDIPAEVNSNDELPASIPVSRKENKVEISLEQYFNNFAQEVHIYSRAFVSANYRGILKTREEWVIELDGKL